MTTTQRDSYFLSFDKTSIHYGFFDAGTHAKPALGNVVVMHGAGEYAGRYTDFAQYLNPEGFRVFLLDLRGYGKSGGPRAYARDMRDFGQDADALIAFISRKYPGPTFVLGHSFGGLVAAHSIAFTIEHSIRGLILSSPCFGVSLKIPWPLKFMAQIAETVFPKKLFRTLSRPEILTHDEELIKDYWADKELCRHMSAGLFGLILKTLPLARDIAHKITCPSLVLQAGDERIVSREATQEFFEQLKSEDKTFKVYEDFFHELLHEKDRVRVYRDITEWLMKHVQG